MGGRRFSDGGKYPADESVRTVLNNFRIRGIIQSIIHDIRQSREKSRHLLRANRICQAADRGESSRGFFRPRATLLVNRNATQIPFVFAIGPDARGNERYFSETLCRTPNIVQTRPCLRARNISLMR